MDYALECAQTNVTPRDDVPMVEEAIERCKKEFSKMKLEERAASLDPEKLRPAGQPRMSSEMQYAAKYAASGNRSSAPAKPVSLFEIQNKPKSPTAGIAAVLKSAKILKEKCDAVEATPIPKDGATPEKSLDAESALQALGGEEVMVSAKKKRIADVLAANLEEARANAEKKAAAKKAEEDAIAAAAKAEEDALKYSKFSCGCLSYKNCFRKELIELVEWPWFDRLSLFAVISNCETEQLWGACTAKQKH